MFQLPGGAVLYVRLTLLFWHAWSMLLQISICFLHPLYRRFFARILAKNLPQNMTESTNDEQQDGPNDWEKTRVQLRITKGLAVVWVALTRCRLCPHHILAGRDVRRSQRTQMKTSFFHRHLQGFPPQDPEALRGGTAWEGVRRGGCAARPLTTQTRRGC